MEPEKRNLTSVVILISSNCSGYPPITLKVERGPEKALSCTNYTYNM